MTPKFFPKRLTAAMLLACAFPLAGIAPAYAAQPVAATLAAEQIPLTGDAVAAFIKSYPDLKTQMIALGKKYKVKAGGKDISSGLAAWMTATAAWGDLNALVTPYGFADFQTWLKTAISVATAYIYAKEGGGMDAKMAAAIDQIKNNPNIPDAQKEMLLKQMQASSAMISGLRPSQANIDVVKPYLTQLGAVFH